MNNTGRKIHGRTIPLENLLGSGNEIIFFYPYIFCQEELNKLNSCERLSGFPLKPGFHMIVQSPHGFQIIIRRLGGLSGNTTRTITKDPDRRIEVYPDDWYDCVKFEGIASKHSQMT